MLCHGRAEVRCTPAVTSQSYSLSATPPPSEYSYPPVKMPDEAVSASARGATFLILLQMGSRAITFALNQFLLRFLSPELLGVSVQLELFVISTLYFARESLRIVAQRRSDGGVQASINLSYLAILAGGPIGFTLAQAYLRTDTPDVRYLHVSLKICHFAAMIELLSEPSFVAVQQNMLYKTRASAEGAAVLMKTFATAGLVFWSRYRSVNVGVLPFAAGEFAYGATLAVVYISSVRSVAREKGFSLLPREMSERCVLSPPNVGVHSIDCYTGLAFNITWVFSRSLYCL